MNKNKKITAQWLLSPWVILVSMVVGVLIGVYNKNLAVMLAPYGKIYLSLLQMCILPVLLSAVATSLGGLVRSKDAKGSIKRMILVFAGGLIITSAFSMTCGLIGQPGSGLNKETQAVLGELVNKSRSELGLEMNFSGPNESSNSAPGIMDFFTTIIPTNIADSMSRGKNLQVLFFAIILGISIGFIPDKQSDSLLMTLDGIYLAFSRVIKWAMYILPFGLCCLMADQISRVGVEILFAMSRFIIVFYIAAGLFFVLNTIIIWRRSGSSFFKVLSGLKEPIIVVLSTRSSFATIPSSLNAMHDKLKFEQSTTNLLVPLGITLCRYGSVFFFSISTIFIAQLYNVSLGIEGLIVVLIGSILAGMATSGATGVVTLSMMLIVLEPLGLPFEAVLVLFIAIDPIIDPMRSLLIVYPALASTALVAEREV